DGLYRSGSTPGGVASGADAHGHIERAPSDVDRKLAIVNASLAESGLPALNLVTGKEQFSNASAPPPIYNTKDAQAVLGHLASINVEAVFILKDMHRHLDQPVVIRLLREVAQEFSRDRRTLVLTAPAINLPPELQNLA